MSLNYNVRGNCSHQNQQSQGDQENEKNKNKNKKTIRVLEKLSQEWDHIGSCHDPLHFQSSLITLGRGNKKIQVVEIYISFSLVKKEQSALQRKALLNFSSCFSLTFNSSIKGNLWLLQVLKNARALKSIIVSAILIILSTLNFFSCFYP